MTVDNYSVGLALTGASLEKRYLRKDGSVLWASVTTRPVRSPSGQIQHYVSTIVDITETGVPRQIVDACVDQLGSLDIVVNATGVSILRKIEETTPQDWEALIATNVVGCNLLITSLIDMVDPALADMAAEKGITADYILPNMDEFDVFAREAAAVATKAVEQGIARKTLTYQEEYTHASSIIKNARDMTQLLMEEGFIAESE